MKKYDIADIRQLIKANLTERGAYLLAEGKLILKGCTEEEIDEIMKAQRVDTLPEVYVTFLKQVGKGAGQMFQGSYYRYPTLLEMKKWALEIVARQDLLRLPEDAFAFFIHQGYHILYFRVSEGGDPPVYSYFPDKEVGDKVFDKLSDYYSWEIGRYIEAVEETRESNSD